MKFTSDFSQRVPKIFEIYLKDTNKRAKEYQACLNIFSQRAKVSYLKIHTNERESPTETRRMY